MDATFILCNNFMHFVYTNRDPNFSVWFVYNSDGNILLLLMTNFIIIRQIHKPSGIFIYSVYNETFCICGISCAGNI
jgi:hypothetical protein